MKPHGARELTVLDLTLTGKKKHSLPPANLGEKNNMASQQLCICALSSLQFEFLTSLA